MWMLCSEHAPYAHPVRKEEACLMFVDDDAPTAAIREALRRLGTETLLLAIHDASFPGAPGEDAGRGTPTSRAAAELLQFVATLGFSGLQLGPQGQTARDNPSPYDGTMFSRNVLSLDLAGLAQDPAWQGLLRPTALERLLALRRGTGEPTWSDHAGAYDVVQAALDEMVATFRTELAAGRSGMRALAAEVQAFRLAERHWLERDALYHALSEAAGGVSWQHWPDDRARVLFAGQEHDRGELRRSYLERHAPAIQRYVLGQFLAHRQHAQLRARAARLGLRLYGDLQIGMAPCDTWGRRKLLLDGYRLGAPPSRTNRDGQPWGYAVLDPARYRDPATGGPGPVMDWLAARLTKLFAEFDGLRIDHPHGLVCPWVYRAEVPDAYRAVQQGARLFESPHRPDHPALARFAIARSEQIDPRVEEHGDAHVRDVEPEQIEAWSQLFDLVVQCARSLGHTPLEALVPEVLSTCPRPLAEVLARHGLGRFRVTQKANVHDPADVYRTENARPEDWVMVGTHDTPSLWALVRQWHAEVDTARQHAAWLASRLATQPEARETLARQLASDPAAMAHARVADLFASRARHTMIFFADFFGYEERYNVPGTSSPQNWRLRLPPDWRARYRADRATGRALDLPRALAMALRAIEQLPGEHDTLIEALTQR